MQTVINAGQYAKLLYTLKFFIQIKSTLPDNKQQIKTASGHQPRHQQQTFSAYQQPQHYPVPQIVLPSFAEKLIGTPERKWSDPPTVCITPEMPDRSKSDVSGNLSFCT